MHYNNTVALALMKKVNSMVTHLAGNNTVTHCGTAATLDRLPRFRDGLSP